MHITLKSGREVEIHVDQVQEITGMPEWLEELPRAKKGQGFLSVESVDGLLECCLGVKCRLENLDYVLKGQTRAYKGNRLFYHGYCGLEDNGKLRGYVNTTKCQHNTLASLNDSGFTFAEIAEIIPHFFKEKQKR